MFDVLGSKHFSSPNYDKRRFSTAFDYILETPYPQNDNFNAVPVYNTLQLFIAFSLFYIISCCTSILKYFYSKVINLSKYLFFKLLFYYLLK